MNSELNDYKIKNADGTSKETYFEQEISFDNDNPHCIKENALSEQKETSYVSETFDSPKNGSVKDNKATSKPKDGTSATTSTSSTSSATSATSVSSAATSVSSAIGGSIGALAGTVAASVMTAVMVVAVFVSTLTINLTLVMASMTSLTFQVELSGAQEEDFANPIFAVLTGEGDFISEQEIKRDSLYLTFDDLEAGKEYLITVKNEEKVFYKKSYFTATEEHEKGSVSASVKGDMVFISVGRVELSAGEYYTVSVKDENGNEVFVKDDVNSAEYSFEKPDAKKLFFSLSVNGKVYAVSQLELGHEYDFNNPVWTWAEDFTSASVSFKDLHGGEPLDLTATITATTTDATCEADGRVDYTATAIYDGQTFKDVQSITLTALGHDYGEPQFAWEKEPTGGYTISAVRTCLHDESHNVVVPTSVRADGNTYYAEVQLDEKTYNATYVALSLNNGNIILYADGFKQGETFTAFENTENSRYIISGSRTDDTPLKFDVKTYSGASVNGVVNYYVDFDNAKILGSSKVWATALIIYPYSPVNIYMANVGTGESMIKGYNHVAFKIQNASELVNIYIDSEGEFKSFDCGDWYNKSSHLYDNAANIHVYMNGVEVDDYGTPKNG